MSPSRLGSAEPSPSISIPESSEPEPASSSPISISPSSEPAVALPPPPPLLPPPPPASAGRIRYAVVPALNRTATSTIFQLPLRMLGQLPVSEKRERRKHLAIPPVSAWVASERTVTREKFRHQAIGRTIRRDNR